MMLGILRPKVIVAYWCFLLREESSGMRSPVRMCGSVSLWPRVHSVTFLWQVCTEVEHFCEVWAPGVLPMLI